MTTGDALAAVIAARSEDGPDEWDTLMMDSEESAPTRTERLTLGEGGFYFRDENRDKKLYGTEITGIILAYTEPRNDFLGDGSDNLPPFCSSMDGVWGKVDLPEDCLLYTSPSPRDS